MLNDQREVIRQDVLADIPAKRYFTISEVAELCDVKPHVLRYWEQEFSHLNPSKRRGNRRYYQLKDILLIRQISTLLYEQGYTIEGARTQLSVDLAKASEKQALLRKTIHDLEAVLATLCP